MKHSNKLYKDYLVSGEEFQIKPAVKYPGLLQTVPTPEANQLSKYYESEKYISHSDEAKGIINRLYYIIKKYNLNHKYKLIKKAANGIKVLDYGCGTGEFVDYLNQKEFNAFGFEPNSTAFKIASSKNNKTYYSTSVFLDTEKFDIITLWHVLEHIPNLTEEICRIKNALKPDGKLFIAVPNYESYDANYYQENWAAYDVPRHLWHFNQKAISEILTEFGMIIETTYPMWFDAFYVSILSEKYQKSSFGFLKAFGVGLISNVKAMQNGQYSSLIYQIRLKY